MTSVNEDSNRSPPSHWEGTQAIKRKYGELRYIENNQKRIVTLSKRKRNLLKKSVELSRMCGIDIFTVFFNRQTQKFTEFNSDPQFNSRMVQYLLEDTTRLQFSNKRYTNGDYQIFCNDSSKEPFDEGEEPSQPKAKSTDLCDLAEFTAKLDRFIIPDNQTFICKKRYQKQLEVDLWKARNIQVTNNDFKDWTAQGLKSLQSSINIMDSGS